MQQIKLIYHRKIKHNLAQGCLKNSVFIKMKHFSRFQFNSWPNLNHPCKGVLFWYASISGDRRRAHYPIVCILDLMGSEIRHDP